MFNGKYDNIDVVMEHEKSVQKTQQQQRELNKREESVCIPLTNRYIELRGGSTTRIFPKKSLSNVGEHLTRQCPLQRKMLGEN